jgi:PAS domain S-box-containing protein
VTESQELRAQNEKLDAARTALDEERRRYVELFDAAPDALIVTSDEGRITSANRVALELLGASDARVTGQRLAKFLPARAQKALAAALHALAQGKPIVERDLLLRPGDGEERIVHARAVTIGGGEVRWALRDVTTQRAT